MRTIMKVCSPVVAIIALATSTSVFAQESVRPSDPSGDQSRNGRTSIRSAQSGPSQGLPLTSCYHAIRLDQNGVLYGTVHTIDPSTLREQAVANVEVLFVQNGRIIARSRSDENGEFSIRGLTGQAVYSVVARNMELYSAFAVAVLAADAELDRRVQGVRTDVQQTQAQSDPSNNAKATTFVAQEAPSVSGNRLDIAMITYRDLSVAGLPPGVITNMVPRDFFGGGSLGGGVSGGFGMGGGGIGGGGFGGGGGGVGGGGGGGGGGAFGAGGLGAIGAGIGAAAGSRSRIASPQ